MRLPWPSRREPRGKGLRRLFGFDRSGPAPRQTRPGQPLRPWTLPNLVGYIRLTALPVFLSVALSSGDGRDATAAAIYLAISLGDYLDGFLARATGQYSRMGALLDPVVDRLTILSGAVVCWHFELLPRWALAVGPSSGSIPAVPSRLARAAPAHCRDRSATTSAAPSRRSPTPTSSWATSTRPLWPAARSS